jgi:ferredoxin--NADP+ reductase
MNHIPDPALPAMLTPVPPTDKATPETLTAVRHWTPKLYSFKTTKPAAYQFTPGQYARLGLADANGNMLWRAYSIVSGVNDDELEFYVIDVPGGSFTSILGDMQTGATIWVEKQPYGFMTADRFVDGEDLWMLATGTGLGPFISILKDPAIWQKYRHLVLVHSVRHSSELAYQETLAELQRKFTDLPAKLRVLHTTTRDPESTALHGRVTSLLENGGLEKAVGLPLTAEASRVMICGNPQMIEDTRKLLHHRGMRPCRRALPGQFLTENYW